MMSLKSSLEPKEQHRRQGVSVLALIASAIMVIGCFLPWQHVHGLFSDPGVTNLDGSVLLFTALLVGGVALYNLGTKRLAFRRLFFLVAIGGLGVAIMNLRLVSVWAEVLDIGTSRLVGPGLYVVMVGGVLMAIAGFAGYSRGYTPPVQSNERPSLSGKPATHQMNRPSPIAKDTLSVVNTGRETHSDSNRFGVGCASRLLGSFKLHWHIYICGAAALGIVIEVLIWAFRYFSW